jgi:hypothetical protein
VDHRGRPRAAVGGRRILHGMQLEIPQVIRAIKHPDVVVFVHGEPGDAAHLPFVRQRLGQSGSGMLWRRLRAEAPGAPSGPDQPK